MPGNRPERRRPQCRSTVTSDIYTSVLPELARAAAEAVVTIVPRTTAPGTRRAPDKRRGTHGAPMPTKRTPQPHPAANRDTPGNDKTAAHVG